MRGLKTACTKESKIRVVVEVGTELRFEVCLLIREGFPVKGVLEKNLKEAREPVLQEETSRWQGVQRS